MEPRAIKFSYREDGDRFTATAQDFKNLKESSAWRDITDWLVERIEKIHSDLEVEPVRTNIHKLQGAVNECKALLAFPDAVLTFMKESAERKEEPNGSG